MSAAPSTPGQSAPNVPPSTSKLTETQPNLSAIVATYRVSELKACIKELNARFGERMSVSGNKSTLAARINDFINSHSVDVGRIREAMAAATVPYCAGTPPRYASAAPAPAPKHISLKDWLKFRPDPFVIIKELLHIPLICHESYSAHQCFSFTLTPEQIAKLQSPHDLPKGLRYQIYFYATAVQGHFNLTTPPSGGNLVEYPYKCDIRVNGTHIDALRLRGLKNKLGTANPLNITSLCANFGKANRIDFAYCETNKKFIGVVYLCEDRPVDFLISEVKRRERISKESVLATFNKAEEEDLVMTQSTLSLRDPAALTRIVVPIRSKHCHHVQCFDARTFLELNKQIPTWKCPHCNSPIMWNDVRIDDFFLDILNSVDSDVDTVVLDPSGKWSLTAEDASRAAARARSAPTVVSLESSDEERPPTARTTPSAPRGVKREWNDDDDFLNSTPVLPPKKRLRTLHHHQPQVIDLTSDSESENAVAIPVTGLSPIVQTHAPSPPPVPPPLLDPPRIPGLYAPVPEPSRLQLPPVSELNWLPACPPEPNRLLPAPAANTPPIIVGPMQSPRSQQPHSPLMFSTPPTTSPRVVDTTRWAPPPINPYLSHPWSASTPANGSEPSI